MQVSEDAARVQISRAVYLWLDEPIDWTRKVRRLRISGWCVAKRDGPLTAIRAQLRGKCFVGYFNRERPEVAAHVHQPDAPVRCGFTIDVRVPFGRGRLELQVARADGRWQKAYARDVFGPLFVGPGEWKKRREIAAADLRQRFWYWFDRPADWSKQARHLHVAGWCIDREGGQLEALRARIGRRIFPAYYGSMRPDVAEMAGNNSALRSGFAVDVRLPPGRSTLILEVRHAGREWERFFSTTVRGPLLWPLAEGRGAKSKYAEWIASNDRLDSADKKSIRRHIAGFSRQPVFSVLLPAYDSNPTWLRRAIRSVRRQLYPGWELCLVDDGSSAAEVWRIMQRAARRDRRIKILRRTENGHICAASNDALGLATGDFVATLDHDDELAPTALYFAAFALNNNPHLRLLYSDEDKLDPQGRRHDPYFKPDWSPDLFTSQNYLSHLSIYATELVRKVGGFRAGFEGAQDYDLALRCIEHIEPGQIHHLPRVLYHWRASAQSTAASTAAKPYAHEAAQRAIQEHLDRGGVTGQVLPHAGGYQRIRYAIPSEPPLVSLIIPTRDQIELLHRCVQTIRERTDYPRFEIIVVDNESRDAETLACLSSLADAGHIRVLRVEGEFNFSALNNQGVAHARGALIGLLNNDLEIVDGGWLEEMVSHALRPGVGAVGARLWFPNRTIQHGGVLLGIGGIAAHAHRDLGPEERGYFSRALLTQNFSAVTAACMVLRKEIYEEAGGLDATNLPVAFNDVDFCLRLRERGWRIVWTPFADLIHHESASRGIEDTGGKQRRFMSEVAFMQKRWGHLLEADPYYNPNLSIVIEQQFELAFPPRVEQPWTKQ